MKVAELNTLMGEKSERGELARTILRQYIMVKNSKYDKLRIADKAKMRHVFYVAELLVDCNHNVMVVYKPAGYFADYTAMHTATAENFLNEFSPYVCDIA